MNSVACKQVSLLEFPGVWRERERERGGGSKEKAADQKLLSSAESVARGTK